MSITISKNTKSVLRFANMDKVHEDESSITFNVPVDQLHQFLELVNVDNKGDTVVDDCVK